MDRPRRSTRTVTIKTEAEVPPPPVAGVKRKKPQVKEDKKSIDYILTNPSSPLVSLELSKLLNQETWSMLSEDNHAELSTLLPPASLPFFQPKLKEDHPAYRQLGSTSARDCTEPEHGIIAGVEPNTSFFKDPFFDGACRTFQDHLFNGHYKPDSSMLVAEYQDKLRSGEVHRNWKDEVWTDEHTEIERRPMNNNMLAGEASAITFKTLIKSSALRVGDILAYRRNFSQLGIIVEKDAIIESIHSTAHTITVHVCPSTRTHLPQTDIVHPEFTNSLPDSQDSLDTLFKIPSISNPTQLENTLLDTDGRVEKNKRPHSNAWKSIGLWRWRENEIPDIAAYTDDSEQAMRGYREYRGTLFYLRGCLYDDM